MSYYIHSSFASTQKQDLQEAVHCEELMLLLSPYDA